MKKREYEALSEYEQEELFRFGFKPHFEPVQKFNRCPQCRHSRWDGIKQRLTCTDTTYGNCNFEREPGADDV